MGLSGELAEKKREVNRRSLSAFQAEGAKHRVVREGSSSIVYTIGYEKRSGDELLSVLSEYDIEVLVDIRQRAFSRKPDFRKRKLQTDCESAGLEYRCFPTLGSTDELRDRLRETGNIEEFHKAFGELARRTMQQPIDDLGILARSKRIALLCYERDHEACHRQEIAEMLADVTGSTIIALN